MSPGILHQMIVHLLVNKANMEIEDVHVEMPFTPARNARKLSAAWNLSGD